MTRKRNQQKYFRKSPKNVNNASKAKLKITRTFSNEATKCFVCGTVLSRGREFNDHIASAHPLQGRKTNSLSSNGGTTPKVQLLNPFLNIVEEFGENPKEQPGKKELARRFKNSEMASAFEDLSVKHQEVLKLCEILKKKESKAKAEAIELKALNENLEYEVQQLQSTEKEYLHEILRKDALLEDLRSRIKNLEEANALAEMKNGLLEENLQRAHERSRNISPKIEKNEVTDFKANEEKVDEHFDCSNHLKEIADRFYQSEADNKRKEAQLLASGNKIENLEKIIREKDLFIAAREKMNFLKGNRKTAWKAKQKENRGMVFQKDEMLAITKRELKGLKETFLLAEKKSHKEVGNDSNERRADKLAIFGAEGEQDQSSYTQMPSWVLELLI